MASVRTCTVNDLQTRLGRDGCTVIDVRELSEWTEGHIDGTTLLPLSRLCHDPGTVEGDVVVVCRSGMRARQAAAILNAAGSCVPIVLDGGFEAWKRAGLPYKRG